MQHSKQRRGKERGHSIEDTNAGRCLPLRKTVCCLLILLAALTLAGMTASAAEAPYDSYTYDAFGTAVASPHGYLPQTQIVTFGEAGVLRNPQDLFVDKATGTLYLTDTGNNRILQLDSNYQLLRIIDGFELDGEISKFKSPAGVFVTGSGDLYICDSSNARVVVLDKDLNLLKIHGKPESDLIVEDTRFVPTKVVVDQYGRIYILVTGSYQGLYCLDANGTFLNYYGANKVEMTFKRAVDRIWKTLLTREAAGKLESSLPIEYSNVYMGPDGFVYATAAASELNTNQIVRLNPMGINIFPVKSPIWYKNTIFSDIHISSDRIITVIDTQKGKVIQCDEDGRLMFAFGAVGTMTGTFVLPCSVEMFNDDVLVLDSRKCSITVFRLTTFGQSVVSAINKYNQGRYVENIDAWQEVVKRDANYLLAYTGLGKAYYQLEDYDMAMRYFKLGYNQPGYSEAYKDYSLSAMRANFGWIVLTGALIVAAGITASVLRKRRRRHSLGKETAPPGRLRRIAGQLRYLFYCVRHPVHGFDGVKWEKRGSAGLGIGIVFVLYLSQVLSMQATGFVFNTNNLNKINIFSTFAIVVGVVLLWFFANWAMASLMNGEGRLKQIWIGSCYALVPYILGQLFITLATNFVSYDFMPFLSMISFVATAWTVLLLFQAMYQVHQLTVGGTVGIILLSVASMLIVVLLIVLLYSLFQQIYVFFNTIFNEIMYRV